MRILDEPPGWVFRCATWQTGDTHGIDEGEDMPNDEFPHARRPDGQDRQPPPPPPIPRPPFPQPPASTQQQSPYPDLPPLGQQQEAQAFSGQQPPYAQPQPYAQQPTPTNSRRNLIVLLSIALGAVALIAVAVVAIVMLLPKEDATPVAEPSSSTTSAAPEPSPSVSASASASASTTPSPTPTLRTPSPSASVGPPAGGPAVHEQTLLMLQGLLDRYATKGADPVVWTLIPDTRENTVAVIAFSFLVTDLKGAVRFTATDGSADAQLLAYQEQARTYEARLLAEEPLGADVNVTLSDGRRFSYDGTTGEGGVTG